jgi:hypothetical protein
MRLATILLLFLAVPLAAQPPTWTLLGSPHHGALPLVVTPDGQAAYTAVGAEVFRSTDGGANWAPFGSPGAEVLDLRLGAGGTLVAGTPAGAFRGADGAWTSLGLGHRVERVGEAGGVLYAWPGRPTSRRHIARSADDGATWEARLITDHENENVRHAHFAGDGTAFVASVSFFSWMWVSYKIFHSTDGGMSWALRSHDGKRFVETPDGSVFVVTPEYPPDPWEVRPQVSRFTGEGWETLAEGEFTGAFVLADGTALPAPADGFTGGPVPGRLPRPTLGAPTASGAWLAATEANGLFRWTEETGWRQVPLGPVEVTLLAERPSGELIAGSGVALLEYDAEGWRTGPWVRGVPEALALDGERTLVASGGRPYDFYAGGGVWDAEQGEDLFSEHDEEWFRATGTGLLQAPGVLIASLFADPGCGPSPYSSGPYRSTDGGVTWQQASLPEGTAFSLRVLSHLPDGAIWGASRDPWLLRSCGGFVQGVFRSTDAGASWEAAHTGLPNAEASAFAWRGGNTFAASPAGGVFRLGEGDVWAPFGLEGIPVHDLSVSADGALLAATDSGLLAHDGVNWVGVGLDGVAVQKLLVREGGEVYAATAAGLYRSDGPLAVAGEPAAAPAAFLLRGIYPNPARTPSAVTFTLPEAGSVRVTVYDLLGRPVLTSEDGPFPPGQHHVTLAPLGLPVGTYVVEVRAGAARSVARWTWLGP